MALRIGKKEVIKQETILIGHGDSATFDMMLGGQALNVEISVSKDESNSPGFNGAVNNGTVSLNFVNWGDAIGVASQEPIKIADTQNGRALWLLAMGKGVDKTVMLNLQFMIG